MSIPVVKHDEKSILTLNSTPFVRQYGILLTNQDNKKGGICEKHRKSRL